MAVSVGAGSVLSALYCSLLPARLAAPELEKLLGEETLFVLDVAVDEADNVRHGLLGKGLGHIGLLGAAELGRVANVVLKKEK